MSKKAHISRPLTKSHRFLVACASAKNRAYNDKEREPGMGDLLKELLFEGPAQLVDIARSAGIDIESLSYVDFDVDPEEETCLYWLVVRRAHEIARDKKVKKVSVEHLFVALFERIADEDYPSVARKAIFKQGLDPVVILAHIREELQPPKSKR